MFLAKKKQTSSHFISKVPKIYEGSFKNRRKPKIDITTPNLQISWFRKIFGKLVFYLSLGGIVSFLIYGVFFSSLLSAEELVFARNSEYKDEKMLQEIFPYTQGNYLKIFPKKHFLFLRLGAVERELLQKFKNLEDITIKRNFFSRLEVFAKEKNVAIFMCGIGECITLDKEGTALNRLAKTDIGNFKENLEIVHDESNTWVEVGEGVNTKEYVQFVKSLRKVLKEKNNLEVREFFTPLPSASEIKVKTKENWLIYFDSSYSLEDQADSLQIILEKDVKEEDKICLEYFDLRIKNKVYYRLVDDCKNLKQLRIEEVKRKEEEEQERAKKEVEEQKKKEKEAKEKGEQESNVNALKQNSTVQNTSNNSLDSEVNLPSEITPSPVNNAEGAGSW